MRYPKISNSKWAEIITCDILALFDYYNIKLDDAGPYISDGIIKIITEVIECVQLEDQ